MVLPLVVYTSVFMRRAGMMKRSTNNSPAIRIWPVVAIRQIVVIPSRISVGVIIIIIRAVIIASVSAPPIAVRAAMKYRAVVITANVVTGMDIWPRTM